MAKKLSALIMITLLGSLFIGFGSVLAGQPIQLIVDGKVITSDVPPQIINGRTMVPARFLAEALGATVSWDASQNDVIVTSQSAATKGVGIVSTSQQIHLIVDGRIITSDVPPQIINGRTMVPARYLAEALGAIVTWDTSQNAVIVTSQNTTTTDKVDSLPAEEVQLTADYWIPDTGKRYVYATAYEDYGQNFSETGQRIVTWTEDANGYVRSWDHKDWEKDGTLSEYGSCEEDTYVIEGSSIYWKMNSGSIEQAGSCDESLVSGAKEILRQVKPGQTWNNAYNTALAYSNNRDNYSETVSFIGMEDIVCLGANQKTAHIKTTGSFVTAKGTKYETTYHYSEDYWLVKDIGIVKSAYNLWTKDRDFNINRYESTELVAIK